MKRCICGHEERWHTASELGPKGHCHICCGVRPVCTHLFEEES